MHKYRIYEVNRDGTKFSTGKVIEAEPAIIQGGYGVTQKGTIIKEVMGAYGFEKYVDGYYYINNMTRSGVRAEEGCFYIYGTCYNNTYGGSIDLWYVEKGE